MTYIRGLTPHLFCIKPSIYCAFISYNFVFPEGWGSWFAGVHWWEISWLRLLGMWSSRTHTHHLWCLPKELLSQVSSIHSLTPSRGCNIFKYVIFKHLKEWRIRLWKKNVQGYLAKMKHYLRHEFFFFKLLIAKCQLASLIISQHWFR